MKVTKNLACTVVVFGVCDNLSLLGLVTFHFCSVTLLLYVFTVWISGISRAKLTG